MGAIVFCILFAIMAADSGCNQPKSYRNLQGLPYTYNYYTYNYGIQDYGRRVAYQAPIVYQGFYSQFAYLNYLNSLLPKTRSTTPSPPAATTETPNTFNAPAVKPLLKAKLAVGFSIGLSLILIFLFACIAYVWCTKTIIVDGRRIRRWKCTKGGL